MTYRCQGCRQYFREVHRRLGLGSVCSPECEATVRTRQRGGTATKLSDRDSRATAPGDDAGDLRENAAPGTGDSTNTASGVTGDLVGLHTGDHDLLHAASGDTDDIKLPDENQRDGTHDSTSWRSDHDSKTTLRDETVATATVRRSTARSRDWRNIHTFERDQRCRYCGTRNNLHAHHIAYRSQGGNDDPHNLITLCLRHHDLVHSDKGLWQPLLRAYIWLLYIEGRRLFLLDIKRLYGVRTATK